MSKDFQRLVLTIFKRFDYEEIQGLRDSVRGYTKARERSIQKDIDALSEDQFGDEGDMHDYRYHLESSAEFLGEVNVLSDELCIVALYKKLEITTRKIFVKFYPGLKKSELHKIDYLKQSLPFDIEALAEYKSIDELRLINNAIKHQGIVSKPLSAYPGWVDGELLKSLGSAFDRLAPNVEKYVEAICEAVRFDQGL